MGSMKINNEVKKYLKDIKKELTCSSNLRLAFIHELKEQIKFFVNEEKDVTINDIIANFGDPKEIANSFTSHDDLQRLNKVANKYKYIRIITFIISVIFILTLVTLICLMLVTDDFIDIINY